MMFEIAKTLKEQQNCSFKVRYFSFQDTLRSGAMHQEYDDALFLDKLSELLIIHLPMCSTNKWPYAGV